MTSGAARSHTWTSRLRIARRPAISSKACSTGAGSSPFDVASRASIRASNADGSAVSERAFEVEFDATLRAGHHDRIRQRAQTTQHDGAEECRRRWRRRAIASASMPPALSSTRETGDKPDRARTSAARTPGTRNCEHAVRDRRALPPWRVPPRRRARRRRAARRIEQSTPAVRTQRASARAARRHPMRVRRRHLPIRPAPRRRASRESSSA